MVIYDIEDIPTFLPCQVSINYVAQLNFVAYFCSYLKHFLSSSHFLTIFSNKIAFRSKTDHPRTHVCSCDLDLDPMTL